MKSAHHFSPGLLQRSPNWLPYSSRATCQAHPHTSNQRNLSKMETNYISLPDFQAVPGAPCLDESAKPLTKRQDPWGPISCLPLVSLPRPHLCGECTWLLGFSISCAAPCLCAGWWCCHSLKCLPHLTPLYLANSCSSFGIQLKSHLQKAFTGLYLHHPSLG